MKVEVPARGGGDPARDRRVDEVEALRLSASPTSRALATSMVEQSISSAPRLGVAERRRSR